MYEGHVEDKVQPKFASPREVRNEQYFWRGLHSFHCIVDDSPDSNIFVVIVVVAVVVVVVIFQATMHTKQGKNLSRKQHVHNVATLVHPLYSAS